MFKIKPLHCAVILSLFGFNSTLTYADVTACAQNSNPATYNTTNRTVTIPALDVPLLEPFSGKPTGEIAVFSAELQQMAGVDDFQLVGNKLIFSKFAPTFDPNHARYDFNDQMFSNGGKLNVCVLIPQVIIVPPNIQIPTEPKKFDVNLRQLAVDQAVFHVESVNKVEVVSPPIDSCTDLTVRTAVQNQLGEAYAYWMVMRTMVVVDYDSSIPSGVWPFPLSNSVTVPTGTYTKTFVSGGTTGTYIDAIMKSTTESPSIRSEIAGKSLRFLFDTNQRVWRCSTAIPNGIPESCLKDSTNTVSLCDNPLP